MLSTNFQITGFDTNFRPPGVRLVTNGPASHLLCGIEVLLKQQWRQRKNSGGRVESLPDSIGGKPLHDVQFDTEEIMDGAFILDVVEPTWTHPARCRRGPSQRLDPFVHPDPHLPIVLIGRTVLAFRRHVPGSQPRPQSQPCVRILDPAYSQHLVQSQVPLGHAISMALETVLLEHRG